MNRVCLAFLSSIEIIALNLRFRETIIVSAKDAAHSQESVSERKKVVL